VRARMPRSIGLLAVALFLFAAAGLSFGQQTPNDMFQRADARGDKSEPYRSNQALQSSGESGQERAPAGCQCAVPSWLALRPVRSKSPGAARPTGSLLLNIQIRWTSQNERGASLRRRAPTQRRKRSWS
jgi:hypothetical protein